MNIIHNKTLRMSLFAVLMVPAMSAMAGRVTDFERRDVSQQQRIQQGLESGKLNSREAAQLQHNAANIDRMQANAMRDGSVSRNEARAIDHAQDRQSNDIREQAHDRQHGNPDSRSSEWMQQDAARNARQQDRILDGTRDGSLTTHEAARLEYGQSGTSYRDAYAGRDGRVDPREQAYLDHREDAQSRQIYDQRHDQNPRGDWYYRWW